MCFSHCPLGFPPGRSAPSHIELKEGKPVYNRGFRLTPKEREQVEVQIKDYVDKGWIRPITQVIHLPGRLYYSSRKRMARYICV